MQLQHLLFGLLMAMLGAVLVSAQNLPPRFNIPGAVSSPGPVRPQFRNEKIVRVRRPVALRVQQNTLIPSVTPRILEEAKPVTEAPEDDESLVDPFLPQLLREQQIAQAQQAQFQQAAAAFLGSEHNALPDLPTSLLTQDEPILPAPRFPERERPQPHTSPAPSSRPTFNDFNIGANIVANAQRFNLERSQPSPAPLPQRGNVIRNRQPVREQRPQYDSQADLPPPPPAPLPVRTRTKPTRPRPIVDEDQLQQHEDREAQFTQQQRRRRPVAQTIRKWREENEDGSITWGYENDDGSFKEEIIGIDCVTKGTYGYIDPDGNKREYHYETGIKCDPNNRQTEQQLQDNGFINYEENKAVLPNGIEIDMSQLGKRKSKRPNAAYRN